MLPEWFTCDPEEIKRESGLEPHQVTNDNLDSTMLSDIASSFETIAKLVLSDLRREAGRLPFPTPADKLAIALPDYDPAERLARIESQKEQAIAATKALVIAKLWYLVPANQTDGPDGRAKGHWITGKSLQSALEKELRDIAKAYNRKTRAPLV